LLETYGRLERELVADGNDEELLEITVVSASHGPFHGLVEDRFYVYCDDGHNLCISPGTIAASDGSTRSQRRLSSHA
jgi:hypothetical protein